jgi:hypothetical protein
MAPSEASPRTDSAGKAGARTCPFLRLADDLHAWTHERSPWLPARRNSTPMRTATPLAT